MASNSERLLQKIGWVHPRLSSVSARLWDGPDLRLQIGDFFVMLHSMVRSSVPLMVAARDESERRSGDDPVAAVLFDYFDHHIPEEMHHDEWLLDDIVALGLDRDQVLSSPLSSTIACLLGAHYYWIFHAHPVALMGYLAVIEGNPPIRSEIEAIRERTGLPADGFRTFLKHADLDPHHRRDLLTAIDRLPMSREQESLLGSAAFHTVEYTARAIGEVVDAAVPRWRVG